VRNAPSKRKAQIEKGERPGFENRGHKDRASSLAKREDKQSGGGNYQTGAQKAAKVGQTEWSRLHITSPSEEHEARRETWKWRSKSLTRADELKRELR